MTANEHLFWSRIKDKVPGHVQRLENMTGAGVPDVTVCHNGKEYWIELKIWTPGTGILIRKEQWSWHNRRMFNGSKNCWLLCYEIDSDVVILMNFGDIKVEPYGTQCKYVRVTNCNKDTSKQVNMCGLRLLLKTFLFT